MNKVVQMHECQLDPAFYRSLNDDLRHMTDGELLNHFHAHGKHEGRIGTRLSLRANFSEHVEGCAEILEIGPFLNPVVAGPNVKYFDVLDTEGLKKRADGMEIANKSSPPHIDFVSPFGDLSVVTGAFDAVVSSHCVEHQPDLIKHFIDVERLLAPGGKYALLIPDKRYCFDHFLPESTIAQVLQAHAEQRRSHSLASVIEHRALITHNDSLRHWRGDHEDAGYRDSIASRTKRAISEFIEEKGAYIDVHAWQFTPDSFQALVGQLVEIGMSPLKIDQVYCTPGFSNEFVAILIRA